MEINIEGSKKQWHVYLIECCDGSFYTGVSNDVSKRMKDHSVGKGSKYVKSKGFSRLLKIKSCFDKSDAYKKEYYVKQLSRDKKINWFDN